MENLLESLKIVSELKGIGGFKQGIKNLSKILNEIVGKFDQLEYARKYKDSSSFQNANYSPSWKLTTIIIDILLQLKDEAVILEKNQSEEEKSIDVLSLQSQIYIIQCIEIVIGLGIRTYLLKGILIEDNNPLDEEECILEDKRIRPIYQFERLYFILESIDNLCIHPTFKSLIIPKYSDFLIGSFFQLCTCPIAAPNIDNKSKVDLSTEEYTYLMTQRKNLLIRFNKFIESLDKKDLIQSLFFLGKSKDHLWLRKQCKSLMNKIFLSKNGILAISRTLIEILSSDEICWNAINVISNLIRNIPKTPENMLIMIFQVKDMFPTTINFESANKEIDQNIFIISTTAALVLTEMDQELTQNELWLEKFSVIFDLLSIQTEFMIPIIQVKLCIKLFELILEGQAKTSCSTFILPEFKSLLFILFRIYLECEKYLKRKIIDSMIEDEIKICQNKLKFCFETLLKSSMDKLHENIMNLFMMNEENQSYFWLKMWHLGFSINFSEDEEDSSFVSLRKIPINKDQVDFNIFELLKEDINIFCQNILKSEEFDLSSLFFALMKDSEDLKAKESTNDSTLVTNENMEGNDLRKFVCLRLLDELGSHSETIENIIDNYSNENLTAIECIMKRLTTEMEDAFKTGGDYAFGETLLIAFGILTAVCDKITAATNKSTCSSSSSSSQNNKKDQEIFNWDSLSPFIPMLKKIRETPHLAMIQFGIPEMAENLIISIETKGKGLPTEKGKKVQELSKYQKAMNDIRSPMIPIKGHGLLELRKLIEGNDKETLSNEDSLLNLFRGHLIHDDSYIYLMAIYGLASIGIRHHNTVIPILIKEYGYKVYITEDKKSESERERGVEDKVGKLSLSEDDKIKFRMKIGDTLVKIIQRLGEMAPVYRVSLTNAFFHLARDFDPDIRASALSNLAELCQLLKFSLGSIITEVWYTVESIIELEKEIEVKRAALHLITLLLRGVSKELEPKDFIENSQISTYLRDARRLMRRIYESANDHICKLHAQLALEELDIIAKNILTLNQSLEFKIRILN